MRNSIPRPLLMVSTAIVGALIMAITLGNIVSAQTTAIAPGASRTIAVTGTGTVTLAPDTAYFSAGVTDTNADITAVQNSVNTKTTAIIEALRLGGVDVTKDAKTAGYSVQPQYNYPQNGSPMLTGYRVTNSVSVTVRDINKAGQLLSVVTQAGANQVGGVSFGLADPEGASSMAREQAVLNARSRAETLAKASGIAIGAVITVDDQSNTPPPRPVAFAAASSDRAAGGAASAPPIQTGETSVTAIVRVTYTIA